jgi:sterol carrier protein 2
MMSCWKTLVLEASRRRYFFGCTLSFFPTDSFPQQILKKKKKSFPFHFLWNSQERMSRKVYVIGVGMTKFEKPGKRQWDYPDMAFEAVTKALADSGVSYSEVQQACVGYVYGDSTCGQRALYSVGLTGIPVYNVNNNCSTGASALFMAKQFVAGGISDCVLALGFEKMERGSLSAKWTDRANPMERHFTTMANCPAGQDLSGPFAAQMFGSAGREHMQKYGTGLDKFAKIAHKNHKHSVNNPYSQFRDEYTLEQIQKAPEVCSPMTKLQCCPTSEGAAAAVLVSEDFVKRHGLEHQAVEIAGMMMATDLQSSFEDSCIKMVGFDMTRKAAEEAYRQAGISPKDVQVIELHDCFSANELVTYEALRLCPEGKAGELVESGNVTYGGQWVVNPSGGLISKGHPLGATGLAQCAELCWQLRGMCGNRQVPNVRAALQHNLGLGGAAVVGVYKVTFLVFVCCCCGSPSPPSSHSPSFLFRSSVSQTNSRPIPQVDPILQWIPVPSLLQWME